MVIPNILSESVITVPVTLKAKWTDHLLTVTFDPTEGKMAGDTEYTIAEGKTFTYLPGANCVDEASSVMLKSFDGWYTEPGGNGKKLVTDPTVAEADPEKYVARITEFRMMITPLLSAGVLYPAAM